MATTQQVKNFLNEFKVKMGTFSVIFRDQRTVPKNTAALLTLDITPLERRKVLNELEVEDYSEGPKNDTLYKMSPMWVFGKKVKGKEVYIKITMGLENQQVICISFHPAESAMTYPLKK